MIVLYMDNYLLWSMQTINNYPLFSPNDDDNEYLANKGINNYNLRYTSSIPGATIKYS
jgi:hypothetical protein